MSDKIRSDAVDLITSIVKLVTGIGHSKACSLAEFFDGSWQTFLDADSEMISNLKKENGNQMLSDVEIKGIIDLQQEFTDFDDLREAWIYFIGKEFLIVQIRALESVSLSNLDFNPFLMTVLDFKTPQEVLEFNLYQTVTRSIVTSWGTTVENLLVRCGGEKFSEKNSLRSGRRPDLQKVIDGKKFYLQIKSGPNTMNVDMVNSLNEVINEYRIREPEATLLLGMTYGKKNRISSQIRKNLNDFDKSFLIGRELWDFVSEEKDFHREIFTILDKSSECVTSVTFSEHLKNCLTKLVSEWKLQHGDRPLVEVFESYI